MNKIRSYALVVHVVRMNNAINLPASFVMKRSLNKKQDLFKGCFLGQYQDLVCSWHDFAVFVEGV